MLNLLQFLLFPFFFIVFTDIRDVYFLIGSKQVPQLSSSRHIDVTQPFKIVNDSKSDGVKRALVIGINYVGSKGELFGCHSDAKNMVDFLKTDQGFEDENITILMDDGHHKSPTYRNIMRAFREIAGQSNSGDTVLIHYSGHGGRVKDKTGDENDGYDETIIPVDYFRAGQIIDDDINFDLVRKMKKGVLVTAMMDCCHSGTILDLPYRYRGGDDPGMGMEKEVFYADDDKPRDCCCFIYQGALVTAIMDFVITAQFSVCYIVKGEEVMIVNW